MRIAGSMPHSREATPGEKKSTGSGLVGPDTPALGPYRLLSLKRRNVWAAGPPGGTPRERR
jgi:hypothetical protein